MNLRVFVCARCQLSEPSTRVSNVMKTLPYLKPFVFPLHSIQHQFGMNVTDNHSGFRVIFSIQAKLHMSTQTLEKTNMRVTFVQQKR